MAAEGGGLWVGRKPNALTVPKAGQIPQNVLTTAHSGLLPLSTGSKGREWEPQQCLKGRLEVFKANTNEALCNLI